MPSVDIVVPCYNYAHFLEHCVASVLSQRDVDVRILILNDASPDNTEDVAQALAASDPRVTYLKNEQNLGLIGTANRGLLDWASADYALLLSADDALTPGSLSRATQIMDAHEDVHLVFGRALLLGDRFERVATPDTESSVEYRILSGPDFLKRNLTHGNPVASPTAIVRTRVQHELGGYLSQFYHTSDMEMWMRFAAHGPIGALKDLQAEYRIHESSMSAPKINRAISDYQERFETCQFVVDRWCQELPAANNWLTDMRRRMAKDIYWRAALPQYSKDERRVCAEFAKSVDPDGALSIPYLKYKLKTAFLTLKPRASAGQTAEPSNDTSSIYGWWPGDD